MAQRTPSGNSSNYPAATAVDEVGVQRLAPSVGGQPPSVPSPRDMTEDGASFARSTVQSTGQRPSTVQSMGQPPTVPSPRGMTEDGASFAGSMVQSTGQPPSAVQSIGQPPTVPSPRGMTEDGASFAGSMVQSTGQPPSAVQSIGQPPTVPSLHGMAQPPSMVQPPSVPSPRVTRHPSGDSDGLASTTTPLPATQSPPTVQPRLPSPAPINVTLEDLILDVPNSAVAPASSSLLSPRNLCLSSMPAASASPNSVSPPHSPTPPASHEAYPGPQLELPDPQYSWQDAITPPSGSGPPNSSPGFNNTSPGRSQVRFEPQAQAGPSLLPASWIADPQSVPSPQSVSFNVPENIGRSSRDTPASVMRYNSVADSPNPVGGGGEHVTLLDPSRLSTNFEDFEAVSTETRAMTMRRSMTTARSRARSLSVTFVARSRRPSAAPEPKPKATTRDKVATQRNACVAALLGIATLLSLVMLGFIVAMVQLSVQGEANPANVQVIGKVLYVDGAEFFVRGVNYNPIPKGEDGTEYPFGDYYGKSYSTTGDLGSWVLYTTGSFWTGLANKFSSTMQSFHEGHLTELNKTFNVIRLYGWALSRDHKDFLDRCNEMGLKVTTPPPLCFPTSVAEESTRQSSRSSERLLWTPAPAWEVTPRGSSSACEQRGNCPPLTY